MLNADIYPWTNTQAAKVLGVKESSISELRHGQNK
jgi:plasmid maintenance system antidote protein VapI